METVTLLILIGVVIIILAAVLFALAKQYQKVGPNEVLIVSGGRVQTIEEPDGTKRKVGYRMSIGGGTFVMPFVESAQTLPLETYTISVKTPEVLTKQGVHIVAEASAQIKVASNEISISRAAEQFLGRGASAIKEVTGHILEGYIRSALGAMTVEEIYQNRDDFNLQVRKDAEADLARMGLELLSFNLGDISDNQGYISALGQPRIAQVKRDAAVATAETEKDTIIKAALARKEGDVSRFQVETEIAAASREFEIKRAEFQLEVNKKKAQADSAYELERHSISAELKQAEYKTKLIEKEATIQLEQQEIKRRELELESSVQKPALARQFQVQVEADAEKYRISAEAHGRAEARITEGKAEVEVKKLEGISRIEYTRNLGKAEADAMTAKADAYKIYNEAAMTQMIVDKLPELTRAISEPLSKVEKIIMVGDGASGVSKLTGQVAEVLAQVPTVVESIAGIDLKKAFEKKSHKE